MSLQKSSPSPRTMSPSETEQKSSPSETEAAEVRPGAAPIVPGAAQVKPFDVYSIVPESVLRKSTKNTWDSKFISANRPRLSEDEILHWADAHFERTGEWPKSTSGVIPESPESTWGNISQALRKGLRGLLGDSSLALLLWEKRGVRNHLVIPDFTIEEILTWIDAFHARTGEWPAIGSGTVAEAPNESWQIVNTALRVGVRGLPGGSSLPRLLAQERGCRNIAALPALTEDLILSWADAHRTRTGKWPCAKEGGVYEAPEESWVALNASLIKGSRGLPGGSSLAQLLAAKRGKYVPRLRPLSEAQILAWADAYFARTGEWPTFGQCGHTPIPEAAGDLEATGETWQSVNVSLMQGTRGLPGGDSLVRLLTRERGRRREGAPEPLTEALILSWADAHFARTGKWPMVRYKCDPALSLIPDAPGESWGPINSALQKGYRGLPGGMTLTQFLEKHRGKTPGCAGPSLSTAQILSWAREYHAQTGHWPTTQGCGTAPGTDERWAAIHTALKRGTRGLPGGDTLAGLLVRECGCRNTKYLPLTEEQILSWADAHYARTGRWPISDCTPQDNIIPNTNQENWKSINAALRAGRRGLPGGSSLAQFLAAHRGKPVPAARSTPLSLEQILAWADAHHARTGCWPTAKSGTVEGEDNEAWSAINTALLEGCRGLTGGSSLVRLLTPARGRRHPFYRTPLTEAQILTWADAHYERTGIWPISNRRAGSRAEANIPEAPGEDWHKINWALHAGRRGLSGGSSLARLLAEHRGKVLPARRTTPLSVAQILAWAQAHHEQTGRWPNKESREGAGPDQESWSAIAAAVSKGGRGLPGGGSLSQLLETHLGKTPQVLTTPLSPEQIFRWAQAHRARTGRWPVKESGPVEGSGGEVWSSINTALRQGKRGLPGGMNLGQLIRSQQEQQKTEQEKGKHQRTSRKAA